MSKEKNIIKSTLTETALLNRYLKSRGINPEFVSKDQKVAHSKTNQFKTWMRDHAQDSVRESITTEKTPTQKKLSILKTAVKSHKEIRTTDGHKNLHSEEVEQVDEVRRGGFTAGWRDEKYFGKGVPTNRPMTDKEKAESEKTKDIQNYLNNLSKNRLKKEEVEIQEEFKKGDRVRHKDGTLGTVTREPDEHGIVSWKHAGNKHRVSHKSALKSAAGEKFRWRKYDEEVEQTDESYFGPRGDKLLARSHSAYDTGDKETGKRAHTLAMKAGEKYRSNPVNRAKATREVMAGASADYNTGKRWTGDSVEYPEDINVVSEISDTTLASYKEKAKKSADTLHAQGQYKKSANRWLNVMKATGKQMNKMKFENTLDPKAATEAPCSCGNNPDDVEPQDKNKKLIQMSKSARIIKSIYKKKNMKEETYDHEKEDKSVATYGKKPKLSDNEKKMEQVGGQPKAAAVMSGGTTLTGTPRDTVEIDPMMKLKPGLIGQTKNNNR